MSRLQQRGALLQQRCGRQLDIADRAKVRPGRCSRRHPLEDRVQPHELVHQPDQDAGGGGQAGGTVGGGEEQLAQAADRGGGLGDLGVHGALGGPGAAAHVTDFRAHPPREQSARADQGHPQRIAGRSGPQHDDGDQGRRAGQQPAAEPGGDGGDRPGQRHRQDEAEQQRGRRAGQHRTDHTGEQDAEADGEHRDGRQPRRPGREGAEADEDGARQHQRRLCGQAFANRAAEGDEQQHRERPERGECGHGRVADHLLGQREHGRHDDRGPARPAQCGQASVPGPQPLQAARGVALGHRAVRWH